MAEEYADNVYGESSSALHRGTPTDRLIAQWRIAAPHVERRLASPGGVVLRSQETADAPVANETVAAGAWRQIARIDLAIDSRRLWLEIPTGFTEMQQQIPDLALHWRMQTREIFHAYLGRGYRVVDFLLNRADGRGRYLLARD